MNLRNPGKILAIGGILCFALAYVMLASFKGEFGKDTAETSNEMPVMEDTIDVTPKKAWADGEETRTVRTVVQNREADVWVVYVIGAVKKPGVYEVKPGARIYEALNAAGGFAENADTEAVNLAAMLSDGMQIKFPRKGESPNMTTSAQTSSAQVKTAGGTSTAASASTANYGTAKKININTASQADLQSVRGIGPKTAQLIIEYRSTHGGFARVEDIMNVKGIGPKKFDKMKDMLTVD